jgi:hypothetical protein
MNQERTKSKQDMPVVARVIALVFGVLLVVGSALIFLFARPLVFKLALLGMTVGAVGVDLLQSAMRGRWPVWALLGLVP